MVLALAVNAAPGRVLGRALWVGKSGRVHLVVQSTECRKEGWAWAFEEPWAFCRGPCPEGPGMAVVRSQVVRRQGQGCGVREG